MAIEHIGIPSYRPGYFVDREDVLDLVLDKVRMLLLEEPVRKRTTAFYGPRGSGKSWLICELCRRLREDEEFRGSVVALSLVLGPVPEMVEGEGSCLVPVEETEIHPMETVRRVIRWAGGRLHLASRGSADGSQEAVGPEPRSGDPEDLSLDYLSWRLAEYAEGTRGPIVVLVDGVDEVSPSFLREFEAYFLAPLVGPYARSERQES